MAKSIRRSKKTITVLVLLILIAMGWGYHVWYFRVLPQNAIFLLSDIRKPRSGDRILVFAPHPDDETLATGGYIARCSEVGAKVWILLVTNGNKHYLEKYRYREFRKATAILGVPEKNLIFLDYPDGHMKRQNPAEVKKKFDKIINSVKPDIVFNPHPQDTHPDHSFTGKIVLSCLYNRGDIVVYNYLVHHPRFPRPEGLHPDDYMLPPVRMIVYDNGWERFMLKEKQKDVKLEAALQYKTQLMAPLPRGLLFGMIRMNELFSVPEI